MLVVAAVELFPNSFPKPTDFIHFPHLTFSAAFPYMRNDTPRTEDSVEIGMKPFLAIILKLLCP